MMSLFDRIHDLALTASGRIGRASFVAMVALLAAVWTAFDRFGGDVGWPAILFASALLYVAANVTAQRLHDIGRAGWWAGPLLPAVVLAWTGRDTPYGWALGVLLLAPLIGLALRPGQTGFNRYGAATA